MQTYHQPYSDPKNIHLIILSFLVHQYLASIKVEAVYCIFSPENRFSILHHASVDTSGRYILQFSIYFMNIRGLNLTYYVVVKFLCCRRIFLPRGYVFHLEYSFNKRLRFLVRGWRSGESTPMWPGFDSQIWRHMWVEFVGSPFLCTKRCSPGTPISHLLKQPPFDLIC